jgi:magnesium-transporting ATPase (P-type)
LRRLLFWHGRSFGNKLGAVIIFTVTKSILYSNILFWCNLFAGYSGINVLDQLPLALYNVVLTNFSNGFFILFSMDVAAKYGHEESTLPFSFPMLYAASRR